MKNILLLGAGKSSSALITYLLDHAPEHHWKLIVGDLSMEAAQQKIQGNKYAKAIYFNVEDQQLRTKVIAQSDIVISLLPPNLHAKVAKECVKQKKHFACASYVSNEMQRLNKAAKENDVILLNEIGLDPGIDHMSAMKIMNEKRDEGAKILSFESYTGGLIDPEFDTNPWNYKFTWNPRNVVLAGHGTAKFLHNKKFKYIPYHKLFSRYDILHVDGFGEFEGYPNRDSLKYRTAYGLQDAQTIVRGTLRKKGYCDAWNLFVQLGMTDDSSPMENVDQFTWKEYTESFLPFSNLPVKNELQKYLNITDENLMNKLEWLGIFSDEKIHISSATPAQILQKLLEEKWKLEEGDKDMCVMLHLMEYLTSKGKKMRMQSTMVSIGLDENHTAMARTVGLPLAIAVKRILQNEITERGVVIPISSQFYIPVLEELARDFQIKFHDKEEAID